MDDMDYGFSTRDKFADEQELLNALAAQAGLDAGQRAAISEHAADLVRRIRARGRPSLMEQFLAEYGLSTPEGVALMSLAEAMPRIRDARTTDALIRDKMGPADWRAHSGQSPSPIVNAATRGLALAGRLLDDHAGLPGRLAGAVSAPAIRAAVGSAVRAMGGQFVLGQTIGTAMQRAQRRETRGYTYSYDMLGEAAMTGPDALLYQREYSRAIAAIARACTGGPVQANPGISIKLSALHPRFEVAQERRIMAELVPTVRALAAQARAAGMGLNIDAEEQDRLVLSLKVFEAVLSDPSLGGWDGFGMAVQAYGKRAGQVIDRLHDTATRLDRKIMVRLVKGAYWDTEIKRAQVLGLPDFPLFTTKTATDVSYIAHARKLIALNDRIYPQFATHNAHTVAAILNMADPSRFEFQRLHGMGEALHDIVRTSAGTRCRIYAPVGPHRELMAYLVRRLLENGANSSFVHQIVDHSVAPETIAGDPLASVGAARRPRSLVHPSALFGDKRRNSRGFDLSDAETLARIDAARRVSIPDAGPLTVSRPTGTPSDVINPATGHRIAGVLMADAATAARAIEDARPWDAPAPLRARILARAADLYEQDHGAIFAILAREAGKTLPDAVDELREAVDFLGYYAAEAADSTAAARGIVGAISPWNFPLAIFTGQVAAALMAGNAVIAKPAERTPIIAARAVALLHEAGVPRSALQLVTGQGKVVGTALASDPRMAGMVFTGSLATARTIARTMADNLRPGTPFVAETGGLNAMIVDSTALPEQAVRDIVASAFRSTGQRCSALRCLYLQEDIAPQVIRMIKGAMDELRIGDPWDLATDVGPVIDAAAGKDITDYLAAHSDRILHRVAAPDAGFFVPPTMLKVNGIGDLEREIFGPVLHVATFAAHQLDAVIRDINDKGYGLTFGLHSRIESRAHRIADSLKIGNVYVNRNQIGAVVGAQPFGGEGLSGTGPKAGGPFYVPRFFRPAELAAPAQEWDGPADEPRLQGLLAQPVPRLIDQRLLPGPTGEMNRLSVWSRGPVLCLGPGPACAAEQVAAVESLGGRAISAQGEVQAPALAKLSGLSAVVWSGDEARGRAYAKALAAREGAIVPLLTAVPDIAHVAHERHLCIDTTAAGGNHELLAE